MSDAEPEPAVPPLLSVAGDPTPEELAAVIAVLSLRRRTPEPDSAPAPRPSAWSRPSRRMRLPLRPGADAWLRTALPR